MGFDFGLALVITDMQLPKLLGIKIETENSFTGTAFDRSSGSVELAGSRSVVGAVLSRGSVRSCWSAVEL